MKSCFPKNTFESFKPWGQLLLAVTLLLTIGIYTSGGEYTYFPERSQSRPNLENYAGEKVFRKSFENSSMKGFNETQNLAVNSEFREEMPESREEERKTRQVQEFSSSSISSPSSQADSIQSVIKNTSNNYYEEQMPVVVHSESGPQVLMSYRQPPSLPPQDIYADDADDGEVDADGSIEYNQQADYGSPDAENYPDRGPQTYYDQDEYTAEGRSNSNSPRYESHQRLPPAPSATKTNRKIQQRPSSEYRNRDSYNVYGDLSDYDYPPAAVYVKPQRQQQQQTFPSYPSSQSFQSYHRRLKQQNGQHMTAATPTTTTSRPTEATFLSVVKQLKDMWDLYRAFATAWNVVAERSQRREEEEEEKKQKLQQQHKLEKQQQKQQQTRPNARKPKPNITTPISIQRRNGTEKTIATTTTTTGAAEETTIKAATTTTPSVQPTSKVEPRFEATSAVVGKKGDVGGRQKHHKSEREKRQANGQETDDAAGGTSSNDNDSEVAATGAEGRYIKGDPLKGYYDFVITEGSYKFWAAFQVGTAILVIYSTFAAIYYSKVNPLVSDYDYTDYLGGARGLSASDQDFVDDDDGDANSKAGKETRTSRWLDFVPKMGHSVKFILDAIDKLPVDQE